MVYAALTNPPFLAWVLRARLWEGKNLRTRPLSSAFRARVEEAVSLETILRAPSVAYRARAPEEREAAPARSR